MERRSGKVSQGPTGQDHRARSLGKGRDLRSLSEKSRTKIVEGRDHHTPLLRRTAKSLIKVKIKANQRGPIFYSSLGPFNNYVTLFRTIFYPSSQRFLTLLWLSSVTHRLTPPPPSKRYVIVKRPLRLQCMHARAWLRTQLEGTSTHVQ